MELYLNIAAKQSTINMKAVLHINDDIAKHYTNPFVFGDTLVIISISAFCVDKDKVGINEMYKVKFRA